MRKSLIIATMALFTLSSAAFAAKSDKKKGHGHAGTVKAFSADSHTITVTHGKKDKSETFKVGNDVDLSKLKVGETVRLKVSDDNVVEAITPFERKKDK